MLTQATGSRPDSDWIIKVQCELSAQLQAGYSPLLLAAAIALTERKSRQRGDDLGAQPIHRLQDRRKTLVSKSIEQVSFLLPDLKHARQAGLCVNIPHVGEA